MEIRSLEKLLKPAFVIRIHPAGGSVESFAPPDATEAQKLWNKIGLPRLLSQSSPKN